MVGPYPPQQHLQHMAQGDDGGGEDGDRGMGSGVGGAASSASTISALEDERNRWYEAAVSAASDLHSMTQVWDRARDALDTATNENLRALAYSIAQRNVAERIANMGGVVVVDDERKARGSSKKKQQADRPSSRTGRTRSRRRDRSPLSSTSSSTSTSSPPPSSTERGISRKGAPPGGTSNSTELAVVNGGGAGDQLAVMGDDGGRTGEGALVLTGFDLESELAVQDIDEARRKLRWLHDHAAQLEALLDDFQDDNTAIVDNNHRLALQVVEQQKTIERMKQELGQMTELYHIATDYSGPDAGLAAITDGSDHDQELPRPGEQGGLLALEGPPAVEGPGGGSTDEPAAVEAAASQAPLPEPPNAAFPPTEALEVVAGPPDQLPLPDIRVSSHNSHTSERVEASPDNSANVDSVPVLKGQEAYGASDLNQDREVGGWGGSGGATGGEEPAVIPVRVEGGAVNGQGKESSGGKRVESEQPDDGSHETAGVSTDSQWEWQQGGEVPAGHEGSEMAPVPAEASLASGPPPMQGYYGTAQTELPQQQEMAATGPPPTQGFYDNRPPQSPRQATVVTGPPPTQGFYDNGPPQSPRQATAVAGPPPIHGYYNSAAATGAEAPPAEQKQQQLVQDKGKEEEQASTPQLAPPPTNLPHPGPSMKLRRRPSPSNSAIPGMSTGSLSNPFPGASAFGGAASGYGHVRGRGGSGEMVGSGPASVKPGETDAEISATSDSAASPPAIEGVGGSGNTSDGGIGDGGVGSSSLGGVDSSGNADEGNGSYEVFSPVGDVAAATAAGSTADDSSTAAHGAGINEHHDAGLSAGAPGDDGRGGGGLDTDGFMGAGDGNGGGGGGGFGDPLTIPGAEDDYFDGGV